MQPSLPDTAGRARRHRLALLFLAGSVCAPASAQTTRDAIEIQDTALPAYIDLTANDVVTGPAQARLLSVNAASCGALSLTADPASGVVRVGASGGGHRQCLSGQYTANIDGATTTGSFEVFVSSDLGQQPRNGQAVRLPGRIEAERFDLGGHGVAFRDRSANGNVGIGNEGTLSFVQEIEQGEWIEFSVERDVAGELDLVAHYRHQGSSPQPPALSVASGSKRYTLLRTPPGSGWQTSLPGRLLLPAGTSILRLSLANPGQQVDALEFREPGGFSVQGSRAPWNEQPTALPGRLEFEHFDRGGEGVAYHDSTFFNEFVGTRYRTDESVDAGQAGDGTRYVARTQPGEWLRYTFEETESGVSTYTVRFRGSGRLEFLFGSQTAPAAHIDLVGSGTSWMLASDSILLSPNGPEHLTIRIAQSSQLELDYIEVQSPGQIPQANIRPRTLYSAWCSPDPLQASAQQLDYQSADGAVTVSGGAHAFQIGFFPPPGLGLNYIPRLCDGSPNNLWDAGGDSFQLTARSSLATVEECATHPGVCDTETYTVVPVPVLPDYTHTVSVTSLRGSLRIPLADVLDGAEPAGRLHAFRVGAPIDCTGQPGGCPSGAPTFGEASLVGGDVVYRPGPGFVGSDQFDLAVEIVGTDPTRPVAWSVMKVHLAVTYVPPPATAPDLLVLPLPATTSMSFPVAGALLGNDSGSGLQAVAVYAGDSPGLQLSLAGANLVASVDPSFPGSAAAEYEVRDALAQTARGTLRVVTAPVARADISPEEMMEPGLDERRLAGDWIRSNDEGGAQAAILAVGATSKGTTSYDAARDEVVFQPNASFYQGSPPYIASFSCTVALAGDAARASTATLTVRGIDFPTLEANADELVALAFSRNVFDLSLLLSNDEGEQPELAELEPAQHGQVWLDGNSLHYAAARGFQGEDTFRYRIRDRFGRLSEPADVRVRVIRDPWTLLPLLD